MGLKEVIEDTKKELENIEAEENKAVEDVQVKTSEEEENKEPEVKDEPEKPAAEEKPVDEEPKDSAAFARMRRELAAEKKARAELEERLSKPKEEAEQPAPDEVITREIQETLQERRIAKAEQEFQSLEAEFAATVPDYADISAGYAQAHFQSFKIQNPHLSNAQIASMTKNAILHKAASYMQKGFDPIESLYNEAKTLGIKPKEKEVERTEVEEKPSSLAALAANKKKNAGTAAARGAASDGLITREHAATMTAADWSKLTRSEKERLLKAQ